VVPLGLVVVGIHVCYHHHPLHCHMPRKPHPLSFPRHSSTFSAAATTVCLESCRVRVLSESRGLGQAKPEPSRQWGLWPGPHFHQAGAPSSRAKAGALGPSRAGTTLVAAQALRTASWM
jgi:hypothetical protein